MEIFYKEIECASIYTNIKTLKCDIKSFLEMLEDIDEEYTVKLCVDTVVEKLVCSIFREECDIDKIRLKLRNEQFDVLHSLNYYKNEYEHYQKIYDEITNQLDLLKE